MSGPFLFVFPIRIHSPSPPPPLLLLKRNAKQLRHQSFDTAARDRAALHSQRSANTATPSGCVVRLQRVRCHQSRTATRYLHHSPTHFPLTWAAFTVRGVGRLLATIIASLPQFPPPLWFSSFPLLRFPLHLSTTMHCARAVDVELHIYIYTFFLLL
jgi:hypothetical protein